MKVYAKTSLVPCKRRFSLPSLPSTDAPPRDIIYLSLSIVFDAIVFALTSYLTVNGTGCHLLETSLAVAASRGKLPAQRTIWRVTLEPESPSQKIKGKKQIVIPDDDGDDDRRLKKIVKPTSRTKDVNYRN
ncbi:hypothetical protein L218DRAFT_573218 [Marasmius fiardii PR-910]|nr:hypothetical protein L218DRAFT_573218 [Marasmius fiardii PR-910]